MYVITGATGNTGQIVARRLLEAGKPVRVVGRTTARLEPLVKLGAEAWIADVAQVDAMARALDGATAAYLMLPPNFGAEDFLGYQRGVVEAMAAAIQRAGVKHAVFLSSVGAHLPDGTGPITGLHRAEHRLGQIEGLNLLNLRPAYFMENLFMLIPAIKQAGVAGSSVRGDVPLAMIATRDIGDHAARRLLELDFRGTQTQELLGQRELTMQEVTRVLGTAIGRPALKYVQFPYADAEKAMLGMGVSQDMARLYTEMSQGFNDQRIAPQEKRSPMNTSPTSIEDFATVWSGAFNAQ